MHTRRLYRIYVDSAQIVRKMTAKVVSCGYFTLIVVSVLCTGTRIQLAILLPSVQRSYVVSMLLTLDISFRDSHGRNEVVFPASGHPIPGQSV
jgi:hypothetical protein